MAEFLSDSSSSEDENKEIDYYKEKKLIKLPKRLAQKDLPQKEAGIKFKKEKSTYDPNENAITSVAEEIVTKTVVETRNALNEEMKLGVGPMPFQIQGDVWMTVGDFSQKRAHQYLKNFVSKWELSEGWLYCIRFLDQKRVNYNDVYTYRVLWSIPTQENPIPKATASVFFTFEVSLVKPRYYPVNVYFSFEYSRLVHQPGKTVIKEHMLRSIIDSKMLLRDEITF